VSSESVINKFIYFSLLQYTYIFKKKPHQELKMVSFSFAIFHDYVGAKVGGGDAAPFPNH
jgi:hypothetical protein